MIAKKRKLSSALNVAIKKRAKLYLPALDSLPALHYFYYCRLQNMKKTEKKIPVEVYSRIVGYFRPVNQWNKGKQEEFKERKEFNIYEISNNSRSAS